ncbi:MAG: NB-ARC domain-containing protein [Chloroflexi bacterium]|nr:NB-ARC domain-containing protein [Chloroflexota bacterium]
MDQINLREVKKAISAFIEDATLDGRVIDALKCDGKVVPTECELWDYKEQANSDAISLAKIVLHIVSFHNSYGGYLVFGVKQAKDNVPEFAPVGIQPGSLNSDQLKRLVASYTGDRIDISYVEMMVGFLERQCTIGLLHIPKRLRQLPPCAFGKNGPEDKPGHSIFKKNSIYFRLQDECRPAETTDDLQFLFGRRDNPSRFANSVHSKLGETTDLLVDNNLPDRNFICPKFIGRDDMIAQLWQWLTDDLNRTKVLAGDGGKGKTSIAYEFAEEVCRTRPYGIDKVVWLTAKTKQFMGQLDKFVRVPRTDFYDTESLLKAICAELAVLNSEIEGASVLMLKKLLNNALSNIPCLIVIDDVDSTAPNEQRMILETAMQFPNRGARFLLTTRMNISYSRASCITVSGLSKQDYADFMAHCVADLKIAPLKSRQVDRMFGVTDGSPLYTESLLRLCRLGMNIDDAMTQWSKKLGSEVRKAALEREVGNLMGESKRVLLACTYMSEASLTELKQVTGYDDERMMLCLEDLKSMFLVSAKQFIEKEPRFAVSNNIARLILEQQEMLVPDHVALEKAVAGRRVRGGTRNSMLIQRAVGAAVGQAIALIRATQHDDAVQTIESALKEYHNNRDLLLARGRCLLARFNDRRGSNDLTMARKALAKAYECGQRKEILYELWYQAEMAAQHPQGAIDVCTRAIDDGIQQKHIWLSKRADARLKSSLSMQQCSNTSAAIEHTKASLRDLGEAIHLSGPIKKMELSESFCQASDDLWEMVSSSSEDLVGSRDLFETAKFCISLGDSRPVALERLVRSAERAHRAVLRHETTTKSQANLLRQIVRVTGEILAARRPQGPEEVMKDLCRRWKDIDAATIHMDQLSSPAGSG